MDFATALDRARTIWNDTPAVRFAFVDIGALAQTLLTPDRKLGAIVSDDRDLVARRCVAGAERLALIRNPLFARRQSGFVDRVRGALTVWVYGPLTADADPDDGFSGAAIAKAITDNGDAETLVFRIASHGGRTEALQLVLNAIARFKGRSIAIIDFFALSASADIACACDRVIMRAGSVLKLHATSVTTAGTANHLAPLALELRSLDGAFAARISRKRRIPLDTVRALINEDRYVAAEEARSLGLCDAITRPLDGAADIISKETDHARA